MTLKIPSQTLSTALSRAEKIVETRNTLPILSMVRLSASGGKLEITTTNLDIEYRQTIDVSGDLEPCCVDAKRLSAMASAAKGDMSMALDGAILTVKAGRSRWAAPVLPADEFPLMPDDTLGEPVAIDWTPIVKRVMHAASTKMSRAYLSGMYMDGATYVASDGYRLACVKSKQKTIKGAPSVIVPRQLAEIIANAGIGHLEWDDKKIRFTATSIADGDVVITGKVIEGSFPDYKAIFAKLEGSEPYAVDAGEFLDAVRRVRIGSDAKERKLRIKRNDGSIYLRIEGNSGFEGEEELTADSSDGFECGTNADYLVAMLQAMDADSVAISHDAPNVAMHLRPIAQKDGLEFDGLLWPMRI